MASPNQNHGFFRVMEQERKPPFRTPNDTSPWEFGNLFKESFLHQFTATGLNTYEQTYRHPRHPHHDS